MSGPARGTVRRLEFITRATLRANPQTVFLFGDNMAGLGLGGQAREMRGEPNAVGVPTKWYPGRSTKDYFTDDDLKNRDVWHAINGAFERARIALERGHDVVIPTAGIGSGLAELPTRAPKLHAMIEKALQSLEHPYKDTTDGE